MAVIESYYLQAASPPKGGLSMPKKLIPSDMDPSEVYPDPVSLAKAGVIGTQMTDVALAGDIPASRLFASLPAATERDIWAEVRREREEMARGEPRS
jgi:hypothetical protein